MVMIAVSSKPRGPHVKWTIPQDTQLQLLPVYSSPWREVSETYRRRYEALAEQPLFKEMNIPAFKIHHRAMHLRFSKPKKDAESKKNLSKKAKQAKASFDAAVDAKVASVLAAAAAPGSGSANNPIAI